MAFSETPRERTQRLGRCTGPHDGGPAPGDVGLDYKAPCRTCGRRVAITLRGRYAHHKRPVAKHPAGPPFAIDPALCRHLANWAFRLAATPGGGDSESVRPRLRDIAAQLTAAADLGEALDRAGASTPEGDRRKRSARRPSERLGGSGRGA